jgi:hypothetical protein
MDKFIITVDACELCVKEYIEQESRKLVDLPRDQRKSQLIHKIIKDAREKSLTICVKYPCNLQINGNIVSHYLCERHLYGMIDSIREFEDEKL